MPTMPGQPSATPKLRLGNPEMAPRACQQDDDVPCTRCAEQGKDVAMVRLTYDGRHFDPEKDDQRYINVVCPACQSIYGR